MPGIEPAWLTIGDLTATGDFDGDGRAELAVNFMCGGGGVSWPEPLVVFDDDRSVLGIVDIATIYDDIQVWRGGISSISWHDDALDVTVGLEVPAQEYYERRFTVNVLDGRLAVHPNATAALPGPTAEAAVDAFKRYFLLAGARRYEEAWRMLSPAYRAKYGGIEQFTSFWNGVATVGIDHTLTVDQAGDSTVTTIRATVWYALQNGTRSNEVVDVDIGHNSAGQLGINDYRVVSVR